MDLATRLAAVEAALADADASLTTELGGQREVTTARLWHGQVLVDWEPDAQAGGTLLRPELLRRLVALRARVEVGQHQVRFSAPGRIVASLSPTHAELVARLGGARRVELSATLDFDARGYRGGAETYVLVERGQHVPLLRLSAEVRPRPTPAQTTSPRTSPAPL